MTNWSKDLARKYTSRLIKQYPSIHVIWAAGDNLAAGSIEAVEAEGKHPGRDILIGGIDLSDEAINNVKTGKQTVSIGGHFLEGAWALVMLYDYHNGIDFTGNKEYIWTSAPYIVTAENVDEYTKHFQLIDWDKIDFKQFSKKLSPEVGQYDFSITGFWKVIGHHSKP